MTKKIPQEVYQLSCQPFQLADNESTDKKFPRPFNGVAYTGEPLKHYYWKKLVIDLDTTETGKKIAVLVDHESKMRAGHASLAVIDGQLVADGMLLSNEHRKSVAQDSDEVHCRTGSLVSTTHEK